MSVKVSLADVRPLTQQTALTQMTGPDTEERCRVPFRHRAGGPAGRLADVFGGCVLGKHNPLAQADPGSGAKGRVCLL